MRCILLPAVLVCCLLALPASSSPQTLRVTTRLLEISVVAETKDGKPVSDLEQEDFTLLDDGRPEKISYFSIESSKSRQSAPRPLPPNVFSNRFERLGDYPVNATVILFDALNTKLTDQAYARQQIVKFLERLRPDDRVALYVVGRGPRVLQDFNGDPSRLLETLKNFKGVQDPSLDAPLYDPSLTPAVHFDSWLGELSFNLIEHFDRDRAYRTARGLVAIARHLERLPGRKNLIWVAGSFPISIAGDSVPLPVKARRRSRRESPELGRVTRALVRANLAVYPVDARGLMAPEEFRADRKTINHDIRLAEQAKFSTMRQLAARTGGRAFYNNNDLSGAFRRAADDARLTYVLGYHPSHDDWDGKFRETKIRVARPGVRLHYRRGYFALPDEPVESWYREETLEAATFSPVEASSVGLTVRATSSDGALRLEIGVDPRDITFRAKDGGWECELDVWLAQLDRRERHLDTVARTNKLQLENLVYQRIMRTRGLVLPETIKPSKKALLV
ncbi:MAG: VWA domain-containing protein, partial [bacterium]|nr:VWA domain-containing protein [bacterium]